MSALRSAPLELDTLFPDSVIKQAEDDITSFDSNRSGSVYKKGRYHPYERQDKKSDFRKLDWPAWKNISYSQHRHGKGKPQYSSRPAKGQQPYKWQLLCNKVTGTAAGQEHSQKDSNCSIFRDSCKIQCCKPCSFCNRASTKETNKSWLVSCNVKRLYIKMCQRCFFCRSIALCPICNKCPSCCAKSTCRGQASKLLVNLAGNGCRSKNSSDPQRGLHPPLSDPAKSHKISHHHKLLLQSSQEQLPVGRHYISLWRKML